jgi:large subunit ribosomal protein L16
VRAASGSACFRICKGGIELWVTRVKPGRILFEVDGIPLTLAKEALALAAAKLPIRTRFVQRIVE